ncbi:MAG: hypothetical protein LBS96_08330 [Oscillospiraceae bacterium]|jgi:hypothetical protein|nr:hypothetical protein [Oscillospiraceae bacterium]
MHWLPVAAGILAGALNYWLLANACRRLLRAKRGGAIWLLAALATPAAGMFVCALRWPQALLFFGVSCSAALVLLALVRGIVSLCKKS